MRKAKNSYPMDILKDYQNQWVALSSDEKEVIAWDDTFKGAVDKAHKKGEKHPVLLKVPLESGGYLF